MSHSHFPSPLGNAPPVTCPQNVSHQLQQTIIGHATTTNHQPTQKPPNGTVGGHHHTTFVPPHGPTGHDQQQQQPQLGQTQPNELVGSDAAQTNAVVYHQPMHKVATVQSQVQPNVRSRKLQVDDALSYLEKVRQQFSNEPQVYNDFLEVMKEFKSHTIDTNGVIRRVSQLFQAYPELIDGFNTFLPHGYEVRVHGTHIFIFEPNGSSSLINNSLAVGADLAENRVDVAVVASSPQFSLPTSPSVRPTQSHSQGEQTAAFGQSVRHVHAHHKAEKPLATVPLEAEGPIAGPSIDGGPLRTGQEESAHQNQPKVLFVELEQNAQLQQQQTTKTGQLIHFSEALGYLNRIKGRFADRPDVYREFLNILSNYQQCEGDQKWSEAEVYQRVSLLFHDELDLMRDFKSFLPDAKLDFSEHQSEQPKAKLEKGAEKGATEQRQQTQGTKPTTAKGADNAPHKRQMGKEQTNPNAKKAKTSVNKITYDVNVAEVLEEIPLRDFVIFEKIHRALQSETIFENFLRTLVMYNKSLVSRSELTDLVTPFLAEHPELLKQFKELLGGQTAIGAQPRRQRPLCDRLPHELAEHIDYNTCRQHGVSYRCLPDNGNRSVCSGRTALCDQVLNDSYVSFPKWSSEDSAPISSKRSPYEDLMCRTEDERFEVDIFIEVNSAAITALEYARRKIETMGHEDAKKFMAEADLGCSPTFLTRAVKKLYGEHGGKILSALKENPLVAVPMVLRRLREKDVECRALRKEYNEIWRDQVEKNFLKSLDHQALTFKANDLKDIRSKGFIQQLENIYAENLQKAIDSGENEADCEFEPQVAIEYPADPQVFHEANELLLHYIKRQPNIPKREKAKIKEVLHSTIPKLFMLQIEMAFADSEEAEESSEKSGDESDRGEEKSNGTDERAESGERQPSANTRQLRGTQRQQSTDSYGTTQRRASGEWAFCDDSAASAAAPFSQCVVRLSSDAHRLAYVMFYGTNPWVLFIRLHAIMCDRLAKIKKRTEELVEEYHAELAIRDKQKKLFEEKGDSVEAQLMNAVDVHLGLRELKKPLQNPENFYQIMLQEMKNLLDGQVEASKFEDTLRSMFDTRAYLLFTMDKLVNALVRQLQNFVGDSVSGQCVEQFEKYFEQRVNGCAAGQAAANVDKDYSEAMEKVLLNQHCFKMFFFNRDHPMVTIELIDTDETESEEDEEEEEEESANVVALHNWKHFLKDEGCDFVGDSFLRESDWKSGRPKFLARNLRYRHTLARSFQCNFGDGPSMARQSPAKNYSEEPNNKALQFYVSNGFIMLLQLQHISENFSGILIRKCRNRKSFRKRSIANTKKFNVWLDRFHKDDTELSARWMTTGCSSRPCKHHEFKFLRFNIYSSKNIDE